VHKTELIEAIRNGSVVTWQHFNLHGEFDFSDDRMVDLVGLTAQRKINLLKGATINDLMVGG
jgi:hypothetical protein